MQKYQKRLIEMLDKDDLVKWINIKDNPISNTTYIWINPKPEYYLGSILQWFEKKWYHTIINNWKLHVQENQLKNWKLFNINLSKPPMEWLEDQNKELVEFMESILDNK